MVISLSCFGSTQNAPVMPGNRYFVEGQTPTIPFSSTSMVPFHGAAWAGGMCETVADAVPANNWSHVAILGNTKNFRVYVNGKVAKESAFQATRGNNKEFMIGGYAGGESYSGAVDDFAIFAEPLDDATINSIMNQGLKSS
ncbi:LamG domain-containing protein, partial [Candidatus Poribacteria bacterium]|nr:LamG domain-containing protein [Candidatus Poribacteria bacterium]